MMKISYRTHPLIQKLNEKKLGLVSIYTEDSGLTYHTEMAGIMRENFKNYAPYFSENIKIISRPFHNASVLVREKMIDDDLFKLEKAEYGTLFFPDGMSYMYYFSPFDISNYGDHVIFSFKDNVLVGHSAQDSLKKGNGLTCFVSNRLVNFYTQQLAAKGFGKGQIINEIDSLFSTEIMSIINFIKYVPVEIKYLPANKREKGFLCKYINDTSFNITHYDSKWFTSFIKSDGFTVRSHLRWQPKKKGGEWTKELIWIDEFQKTGYTAPARKLSLT